MSDRPATTEQPPPTGTGVVVVDWLTAQLRAHAGKDGAGLIADLEARKALGIERYGTPLRTRNGRDALVDAYQEALDLLVYLAQAHLEGSPVLEEMGVAVTLCDRLRGWLDAREVTP